MLNLLRINLNLENLKKGDEVTTLRVENGKTEFRGILIVGEWSEQHGRFLLMSPRTGKVACTLPVDGVGYDFMSRRENPDFFYSANPAHIRKAKTKIARAQKIREKKENLLAAKRKIICNFCESYRDNEECYSFEYVPPETLERLTVEQLETLASWLK
jgi:hypothetical protein